MDGFNIWCPLPFCWQAITHFNRQLATNRQLRDEIDHLRQERGVFESLYKRLSRELDSCKQEMTDVIQTSTQALEQRLVRGHHSHHAYWIL